MSRFISESAIGTLIDDKDLHVDSLKMVAASVVVLVAVLADEYLLRCPLVFIPQELVIALHFCLWAIEYRIVDLWRALQGI